MNDKIKISPRWPWTDETGNVPIKYCSSERLVGRFPRSIPELMSGVGEVPAPAPLTTQTGVGVRTPQKNNVDRRIKCNYILPDRRLLNDITLAGGGAAHAQIRPLLEQEY